LLPSPLYSGERGEEPDNLIRTLKETATIVPGELVVKR
jgi:hypothetical protein